MRRRLGMRPWLALLLGAVGVGHTSCDSYTCDEACAHLADCEESWLSGDEADSWNRDVFVADCRADCQEYADTTDCIAEASCDELRDGKCTDDFVF